MMKISKLYVIISSIRLTIFLCTLLALVLVPRTLIPQNATDEQYGGVYGSGIAQILVQFDLNDLCQSAGFVVTLCLLAVNPAACTVSRLQGTWRSVRREPFPPSDTGLPKG